MKQQIAICGAFVCLVLSGCTIPKKEPKEPTDTKEGCGCQSSENVLDLRGTTENSVDSVTNPTARL